MPSDSYDGERPSSSTGLCATCRHAEVIRSARGSQFLLCRFSFSDPLFPKYPRLPVLLCAAFTKHE
jgi:hypothetical protein